MTSVTNVTRARFSKVWISSPRDFQQWMAPGKSHFRPLKSGSESLKVFFFKQWNPLYNPIFTSKENRTRPNWRQVTTWLLWSWRKWGLSPKLIAINYSVDTPGPAPRRGLHRVELRTTSMCHNISTKGFYNILLIYDFSTEIAYINKWFQQVASRKIHTRTRTAVTLLSRIIFLAWIRTSLTMADAARLDNRSFVSPSVF